MTCSAISADIAGRGRSSSVIMASDDAADRRRPSLILTALPLGTPWATPLGAAAYWRKTPPLGWRFAPHPSSSGPTGTRSGGARAIKQRLCPDPSASPTRGAVLPSLHQGGGGRGSSISPTGGSRSGRRSLPQRGSSRFWLRTQIGTVLPARLCKVSAGHLHLLLPLTVCPSPPPPFFRFAPQLLLPSVLTASVCRSRRWGRRDDPAPLAPSQQRQLKG